MTIPKRFDAHQRALWRQIFKANEAISPESDGESVARLIDLLSERAIFANALAEGGPLLSEPLISPTGQVVGSRTVANPAEAMLRRSDKAIDALAASLGMTPVSKARLGASAAQDQTLRAMWEQPGA